MLGQPTTSLHYTGSKSQSLGCCKCFHPPQLWTLCWTMHHPGQWIGLVQSWLSSGVGEHPDMSSIERAHYRPSLSLHQPVMHQFFKTIIRSSGLGKDNGADSPCSKEVVNFMEWVIDFPISLSIFLCISVVHSGLNLPCDNNGVSECCHSTGRHGADFKITSGVCSRWWGKKWMLVDP